MGTARHVAATAIDLKAVVLHVGEVAPRFLRAPAIAPQTCLGVGGFFSAFVTAVPPPPLDPAATSTVSREPLFLVRSYETTLAPPP